MAERLLQKDKTNLAENEFPNKTTRVFKLSLINTYIINEKQYLEITTHYKCFRML